MSILAKLWRAIVFTRTYDAAFWTLERLSDRQLAASGIARAEIRRVADRVARLAAGAALSPFHFLRALRLATGLTPHRSVQGRRLEHARRAIDQGVRPAVAGPRVGLTHERHFRAAFRRHHGFAPDEVAT